jgi:hypothetical protein
MDDSSNPWGGPSESKVNTRLVELILSAASVGASVAHLSEAGTPERAQRADKAWNLFSKAESMILSEMGRGKRVAAAKAKAAEELEEMYLPEDDEDDEQDMFNAGGGSL